MDNWPSDSKWHDGFPEELKPGMLIEFDDGTQDLVGHVNALGGVCDCCDKFRYCTPKYPSGVTRWMQLVDFVDGKVRA